MTPEERAHNLYKLGDSRKYKYVTEADVTEVIRAAVAEEREACARVADKWDDPDRPGYSMSSPVIAAAIRARGSA